MKKSTGIRCSHKDYTYCVLTGTQQKPNLIIIDSCAFPKGFGKAKSLQWMVQEIELIVKQHEIELVAIKKFEGRTKGNDYEARVEHEAAAIIAAANNGITAVYKKGKGTIAKDLGLKGRAKYLQGFDTTHFADYEKLNDKEKDAVLVAWSVL